MFSVRPYVFRKLLRTISLRTKIFVRKETHVSEEKKKKKKYCAITFELHSNVMFHLKVQILFNKAKKIVFFSEEQRRLAYSKKAVRSTCLANKKVVEKAPSWDLFQFIGFTQSLLFIILFILFRRLLPFLK